jgi:hypothetical protein
MSDRRVGFGPDVGYTAVDTAFKLAGSEILEKTP